MALRIGNNAADISYYTPNRPFLNVFKLNGGFATRVAGANSNQEALVVWDANDWPTALTGGGLTAGTSVHANCFQASVALYPAGSYTVLWDGEGTVRVTGDASMAATGTSGGTFTVVTPLNGFFVEILTTNPANYVRNIAVVPTAYLDLYNAGEIFHPTYLARAQGFHCYRFLQWNATLHTREAEWAQRMPMEHCNWNPAGGTNNVYDRSGLKRGVPHEVMVGLCNKIGADCWLQMPLNASDDYFEQCAQFYLDNLDPGLNVYIELFNEWWLQMLGNQATVGSRPCYADFIAASKLRSPAYRSLDGTIQMWTGSAYHASYGDGNFGFACAQVRSTEMAIIWRDVWGDSARCRPVLCSQAIQSSFGRQQMNAVQPLVYPLASGYYHRAFSTAPYFGDGPSTTKPFPHYWSADGDVGGAKMIEQCTTGGLIPTTATFVNTTGTSSAFLATYGSIATTPTHGDKAIIKFHTAGNGSATLAINGGTAYPLTHTPGMAATLYDTRNGVTVCVTFTQSSSAGATFDQWCVSDPAVGTSGLFDSTLSGLDPDAADNVADIVAIYGLELALYECGHHFANNANDDPVWQGMITAIIDNPDYKDAFVDYFHRMDDLNVSVACHYYDIGTHIVTSQVGTWGALENVDQTSSPRYDALRQLIEEYDAENPPDVAPSAARLRTML